MPTTAAVQPRKRPYPRARHACLRCRKQKLRCDNTRPCALCLRVGAECQERPDRCRFSPEPPGRISPRQKNDPIPRPVEDDLPTSPYTPLQANSPPTATRQDSTSQEVTEASPQVYQTRTSTYGVVDRLFREHNSHATVLHTSAAIPGASPETRTSEAGIQYLLVSDILGEKFPPPHIVDFTIDAYANAVHWFMLLFHEATLKAEIQAIQTTGVIRADRVPVLILVVLVIAIGAKYAMSAGTNAQCRGFDLEGLGTRFIRKTEEKLLDVYEDASIEAVQISMVLSSFYLYHSRPSRSAAVLGGGLKVALALGLHKESSWKISDPVTREVWKRLSWALYTAEVFGSLSYGTPCSVREYDWDVSMPGNLDDTAITCPGFDSVETYAGETYGPVTVCSYQRYKFRLYRIAWSITRNVYRRSGAALDDIVREIKSISNRLQQWEKSIPRELRLKHLTLDGFDEHDQRIIKIFQLQALVLQLCFDNIQLVLHRPLFTLNHLPTSPARGQKPAAANPTLGDATMVANDMIKTSKYQCWVSSMRTSRLGDYADILSASRNTHGAAYVGIQTFTAGVVLGIFALSDPLSDQAHQAKRAVSKIIKLPRLHGYRTTVSDQCGAVLEELLRLILAEEMKALLVEGNSTAQGLPPASSDIVNAESVALGVAPILESTTRQLATNAAEPTTLPNVNCSSHFPENDFNPQTSTLYDGLDPDAMAIFPYHLPEIPRDIETGNFSEALTSLQDVIRDGRYNLSSRPTNSSGNETLSTLMAGHAEQPPGLANLDVTHNPRPFHNLDSMTQAWIWDDLFWPSNMT